MRRTSSRFCFAAAFAGSMRDRLLEIAGRALEDLRIASWSLPGAGVVTTSTPSRFAATERSAARGRVISVRKLVLRRGAHGRRVQSQLGIAADPAEPEVLQRTAVRVVLEVPTSPPAGSPGSTSTASRETCASGSARNCTSSRATVVRHARTSTASSASTTATAPRRRARASTARAVRVVASCRPHSRPFQRSLPRAGGRAGRRARAASTACGAAIDCVCARRRVREDAGIDERRCRRTAPRTAACCSAVAKSGTIRTGMCSLAQPQRLRSSSAPRRPSSRRGRRRGGSRRAGRCARSQRALGHRRGPARRVSRP